MPTLSSKAYVWLFDVVVRGVQEINVLYYSTITPFYHIWSREHAKYEKVIYCGAPVGTVENRVNMAGTGIFQ